MFTRRQYEEETRKRNSGVLRAVALGVGTMLVLLGSAANTFATDYYLSPNGNDTRCTGLTDSPDPGSGSNEPCAWATLNKCGQQMMPGDRCLVTPGTYRGQRQAGFFQNGTEKAGSPFADQCTFTQGSTAATCVSTVGIEPGDWVFGVATASANAPFNWTRVSSKTSTTLTFDEGYRGPTVTSVSVRAARMIEIVGVAASPAAAVFSNWFDPPVTINWQQDDTYGAQNVWYYLPSDIADTDISLAAAAWRGKFCSNNWSLACTSDAVCISAGAGTCRIQANGFRDLNLNWDTYYLPITNGREGYLRLGSVGNNVCYNDEGCQTLGEKQRQNCPAGDLSGQTDGHRYNVSTVPGSYTYDTVAPGRIYVHLRKVCTGGNRAGYNCLTNYDCFGGTCDAGPPPWSRPMQAALYTPLTNSSSMTNPILDAQGNFVVVRNLTFEGGFHEAAGSGTIPQEVIGVGGSNSLYSNLHVWQGQIRWFMTEKNNSTAPIARTQFEHIKALSGSTCLESADLPLSGVRFYDVEMRGTKGQLFNCGGGFRGAASDDPVLFDRLYAHRNYPDINGDADGNLVTCNQSARTWDVTTQSFVESRDYIPGHGVFWGTQTSQTPICNVTVQNSIFEMTGGPGDNDALTFFGVVSPSASSCDTNKLLFSTFVSQVDPNNPTGTFVANRSAGIKIGSLASGATSAKLIANGNLFLSEWTSDSAGGVISRTNDPDKALIPTAEYNRYLFPKFPAEAATTPGSVRIWNATETLKALREDPNEPKRREVTSQMTCLSGCGANANHLVSPDYYLEDPIVADGTPSFLNPKPGSGNILVDVAPGGPGNSSGCPLADFLGNPRVSPCDAGAIERCTPVTCTSHCGVAVPNGCGGFNNCGPCNPKPAFGSCRLGLEVSKASCSDSMICNNSANNSFQSCLLSAGLTGIFKSSVALIGTVSSGYPSSIVFQVNNTSGSSKPGRVTILNGANAQQLTVSSAQVRQGGIVVYDSPTINPTVSWGETMVTLQPGLNTFTIDNLTDRFGSLSVFVSEEALTP